MMSVGSNFLWTSTWSRLPSIYPHESTWA